VRINLEVHAPYCALVPVVGCAALHDALIQTVRGEVFGTPRSGEIATLIADQFRLNDKSAFQLRFNESHTI
jgi:hypothetical protein